MVGDQRRTTLQMRQQFSVHSPQTVEKIQVLHYCWVPMLLSCSFERHGSSQAPIPSWWNAVYQETHRRASSNNNRESDWRLEQSLHREERACEFIHCQTSAEDVTRDLLNARKVGEEAYQVFKEQRLESSPPQKKFHDTMKWTNSKPFLPLVRRKRFPPTAGRWSWKLIGLFLGGS